MGGQGTSKCMPIVSAGRKRIGGPSGGPLGGDDVEAET